jgi:hypothetical protein
VDESSPIPFAVRQVDAAPKVRKAHGIIERIGRRDLVALSGVVLAAFGIPLALATAARAIGIPSNDDWVYIRAATHLYETGTVEITGHSTAFIGQLLLAQPLLWLSRGDVWAYTAFGLLMSGLALGSTYLLARRFVSIASALFVVLLTLAFPSFVRLSASFMTDVPAFAFAMLCLLLGIRWLDRKGGNSGLAASLIAGLIAVSIREFAVAAPVAVLIAAWVRARPLERRSLILPTVIAAGGVVAVLTASGLASGRGAPSSISFPGMSDLGLAFATLAVVLLPAIALYVASRSRDLTALTILAAAVLCLALIASGRVILGNLWTPQGFGGDQLLAGHREPLFGDGPWMVTRLLALLAAILATAAVLGWSRRRLVRPTSISVAVTLASRIARSSEAPLVLFLIGYSGELVLYGSVGGLFDRYLIPIVPVAAILLLRRGIAPLAVGRPQALSQVALAFLVLTSGAVAANSFAYDAARVQAGEVAVAMGYDPTTIDAGYEWVGMHGNGPVETFHPTGVNWWQSLWTSFRPCAILSNSRIDLQGYSLVRVDEAAYRQYLFVGPPQPLFLYGAAIDGCPAPTPIVSE